MRRKRQKTVTTKIHEQEMKICILNRKKKLKLFFYLNFTGNEKFIFLKK